MSCLLDVKFPRFHFGLEKLISWQSFNLYSSNGKYTPEEGQQTSLPESTCDIRELFQIYIFRMWGAEWLELLWHYLSTFGFSEHNHAIFFFINCHASMCCCKVLQISARFFKFQDNLRKRTWILNVASVCDMPDRTRLTFIPTVFTGVGMLDPAGHQVASNTLWTLGPKHQESW